MNREPLLFWAYKETRLKSLESMVSLRRGLVAMTKIVSIYGFQLSSGSAMFVQSSLDHMLHAPVELFVFAYFHQPVRPFYCGVLSKKHVSIELQCSFPTHPVLWFSFKIFNCRFCFVWSFSQKFYRQNCAILNEELVKPLILVNAQGNVFIHGVGLSVSCMHGVGLSVSCIHGVGLSCIQTYQISKLFWYKHPPTSLLCAYTHIMDYPFSAGLFLFYAVRIAICV